MSLGHFDKNLIHVAGVPKELQAMRKEHEAKMNKAHYHADRYPQSLEAASKTVHDPHAVKHSHDPIYPNSQKNKGGKE